MKRIKPTGMAEFLLGPQNLRTEKLLRLFSERLRARGFQGDPIWFKSASCVGVIVPREAFESRPFDGEEFEFIEDQWPEALGFRLTCTGEEITIESDHFSLRPMFWGSSKRGSFVGSSLQWVAAANEAEIDPIHAVEMMLVTFNLADRTPMAAIHRANPGQKWSKRGDSPHQIIEKAVGIATVGAEIQDCTGPEGQKLLNSAATRIAEMMADGCCIELSGGLDSRCNLALGNWKGERPCFAFTLGQENDEDVRIAKLLCDRSGVDHHRIEAEFDFGTLEADTSDYLEAAGYQVNAASYCWMPSLFRALAPMRETQLCGQMASTAFFYTPFDPLVGSNWVFRKWVDTRLIMSGNKVEKIVGATGFERGRMLVQNSARELIAEAGGTFRSGTDQFFLYQRNRQ